ncbi:MAG: hypothetical protein MUP28_02565 [Candidatus Aminicenantes bacterium]|nr:hypothetical protein [Candidatus Aminicenantes bacterium]
MKKILGLAVIIAIGYLSYNHFFNKPISPDESDFRRIEDAYDSALSRYGQSNRMFAVSGMDITADIQDVANTVERLKKELADLKGRVADDELLQKIAGLESKMDKFLSDKR